jgi:NADPH:quinone reductase-like Zn-dependent oxidoreductase
MRAIWITRPGGPEALEVRETADPDPAPGQVRIRVRAAGLCFADVMAAQGLYPDAPKPPCVVGYEVAGVVDALGDDRQGQAAGRRVLAMTHFGGHADVVLDPLGGHDWRKGLKLLRPGGRLVAFGFANLASGQRRRPVHLASQVLGIPLLTPLQLMNHNRTVSGVNIGRLWEQVAELSGERLAVLSLWDQGKIKPRIDRSYPFTEAAAAHRRLLQRQNIGKILLTP